MGRQAQMATIAAALQNPTPTPLTADEKRGYDVARQQRQDDEKSTRQQLLDNEKAFQQELTEQKEQEDLFTRTASDTTQAIGNIVRGTSVRLERLPTPGSLVLPLVILLVFFFLLLPVNGHTRFVWIWLVLTGNADIGGNGNSNGGSSGNQGNSNTGGSNQSVQGNTSTAAATIPSNIIPIPAFNFSSSMTGVEDL